MMIPFALNQSITLSNGSYDFWECEVAFERSNYISQNGCAACVDDSELEEVLLFIFKIINNG
jgi:hypothetical protein